MYKKVKKKTRRMEITVTSDSAKKIMRVFFVVNFCVTKLPILNINPKIHLCSITVVPIVYFTQFDPIMLNVQFESGHKRELIFIFIFVCVYVPGS